MDPPGSPLVRTEDQGPIRLLTIDHPPVNVLSRPVLDALIVALDAAEDESTVRVVVLLGAAEKAFAAGADIREMASMTPDEARVHGARGQEVTRRIESLPLPVIAAVHGVCLGGGCEVALACDFVLASPDARFGQPEINLGVTPGWGGSQRLPRRIGVARAREWIYTGRAATAEEAAADGWVLRVVPRDQLRGAALALATELARKPPLAIAAAKYQVNRAADPALAEALEFELDIWARLFGHRDQRDGMRAFLAKQPVPPRDREGWVEESAGFPWGPTANRPGGKRNKGGESVRE